MRNAPHPSVPRRRTILSPLSAAAIVYALAAMALWFWYPRSPRQVIELGPSAQFAGFTPDGQSMVMFHPPQFIQFWNLQTGQRGISIKAELPWELPIEFSADGKRFSVRRQGGAYSAGCDFYDVESGVMLSTVLFPSPGAPKAFVSESPDGLYIACGAYDATLVYDVLTGKLRYRAEAGTAAVFSTDGTRLAVGTKADSGRWAVKLYDSSSGDVQPTALEGDGIINSVAFSPQGDKLALAVFQDTFDPSDTRGIQVWDLASGKREQTLPMPRDDVANVGRLRFLGSGQVVSTAGLFRGFAWDLTTAAPDNLVGKTGLTPFAAQLCPDGDLAAILDASATETMVRRLGIGKSEIVWRRATTNGYPIAMTPDAWLILSSHPANGGLMWNLAKVFPGLGSRYEVIDVANGRELGSIPQHAKTGPLAVSPDGRTLVTTEFSPNAAGRLTLWNVPTATPWPAILGFAMLPAIAIGWLFRKRRETAIV